MKLWRYRHLDMKTLEKTSVRTAELAMVVLSLRLQGRCPGQEQELMVLVEECALLAVPASAQAEALLSDISCI